MFSLFFLLQIFRCDYHKPPEVDKKVQKYEWNYNLYPNMMESTIGKKSHLDKYHSSRIYQYYAWYFIQVGIVLFSHWFELNIEVPIFLYTIKFLDTKKICCTITRTFLTVINLHLVDFFYIWVIFKVDTAWILLHVSINSKHTAMYFIFLGDSVNLRWNTHLKSKQENYTLLECSLARRIDVHDKCS